MLAGEFTGGALNQLESLGFRVLYFPYELILLAFKKYGIDAGTKENTTEKDFLDKINKWNDFEKKKNLARYLLKFNRREVDSFFESLEKAVARYIVSIRVLPLHGESSTLTTVNDAIHFIENYRVQKGRLPVLKYEIVVRYNNGDKVEGALNTKESAVDFLRSYASPKPKKGN